MNDLAIRLCDEASGAVLGYVQSDEISIFIHNYKSLDSQPWFGNEVQKIVSITAGLASSYFTSRWGKEAMFDARVFILPESEVTNYLIWRQKDCIRNSVSMSAQAIFSHKQHQGKKTSEKLDMLLEKGVDWFAYPIGWQRGRAIVKVPREVAGKDKKTGEEKLSVRHVWQVEDPPIFTEDRNYIERHLKVVDSRPTPAV
jgi:tRNA(His) 5'-end guanylyltransferase